MNDANQILLYNLGEFQNMMKSNLKNGALKAEQIGQMIWTTCSLTEAWELTIAAQWLFVEVQCRLFTSVPWQHHRL